MKTIFKNGDFRREVEEIAESQVKHFGWKYVPKSEYKAQFKTPELPVDNQPSDPQDSKVKYKKGNHKTHA